MFMAVLTLVFCAADGSRKQVYRVVGIILLSKTMNLFIFTLVNDQDLEGLHLETRP